MTNFDHDFVIVGSGFGGSVAGLRLVEKGYDVLMLEKGPELGANDFPKTNWNLRKWLWMPSLGFRGLFQMRFFRHVTVLAGVGVGGGSLVYANTLPIPNDTFFTAAAWAKLADWATELAPHYRTARRMLGAETVPFLTPPDRILREIAAERGEPDKFESTTVAVHFGEAGKTVPDPYFDGEGPERTGCIRCGACMTGCRHGAKNTLDKNYLWLARKKGLHIVADTEVTKVQPLEHGGYQVEALQGTSAIRAFRKKVSFTTREVVFAGGVLGTVDLFLRLKQDPDGLPGLSDRVGTGIRTNSEALVGVLTERRDQDWSKGVAIGSILNTDARSHLEVVRYGSGSGFFRLLMAPHIGGNRPGPIKFVQAMVSMATHPLRTIKAYTVYDWAKYTAILLYMRTTEGTLRFRQGSLGLRTELEEGEAPTASIPEATELAQRFAEKMHGFMGSLVTETALNIPTTAHILGGCCMGEDGTTGVIDHRHRVFGYDGLYVVDGSAISANPGVNPSLTITAMAERAMSFVPAKI